MARTVQPPVNYLSKGAGAMKYLLLDPENDVWFFSTDGAPTAGTSGDGAGWAGIGSIATDRTNGKLYINTGTLASPTWTVVGSQS
jgi:hypothetical protein